jgi:O-antigen/teichoic acid export membrane protein
MIRGATSAAAWTLIDQGVVSAGTFALNILLARQLAAPEYGAFVVLLGGLATLQLVNATLLFHPLSVRLAVADPADQPRLMSASLALVMILSAGLAAALVGALAFFGRSDLTAPVLACFLAWQMQEATRRGLLTSFRHRAAIVGDALTYLGRVAVALALLPLHLLTLAGALYAIAATSVVAALVQAAQLGLRRGGRLRLRETVADYWSIGGWWSLGNGLLVQVRNIGLPWVLAAGAGAAAIAGFQAAANIVNLANPLVIGLCNIIPQAASRAHAGGSAQAWRVARGYALLPLPLLLGFAAVVLVVPDLALRVLYGAQSQYAGLALPVRLLMAGGLAAYAAEMVISYLHGVCAPRLAFHVNLVGALATAALAWPMLAGGVTGAAVATLVVNLVRLAVARAMLARAIAEDTGAVARRAPPRPA